MTVNLDCLIFFDCFSKRARLRRPARPEAPTKDRLIGKIMGGNPAFRGTRVPVHLLAELVPSRVRARTWGRRGSVVTGERR